jgi:hypothetical protein
MSHGRTVESPPPARMHPAGVPVGIFQCGERVGVGRVGDVPQLHRPVARGRWSGSCRLGERHRPHFTALVVRRLAERSGVGRVGDVPQPLEMNLQRHATR